MLAIVRAARTGHPRPQLWRLAAVNREFRASAQQIVRQAIQRTLSCWFSDPGGVLQAMSLHSAVITGTPAAMLAVELGFESDVAILGEKDTATFFVPHGCARWEVSIVVVASSTQLTYECSCFSPT